MAKKPPRRKSRFASEAALNAAIKYGPQSQALNELMQQAMEGRDAAIQAAKGTSAGAIAQIDQAAPALASLYNRAQAEQQQRASVLGGDLAGLGSVASSIRAAALTEQSQGATDLSQNRVGALTDLLNRKVQAQSGAMFATNNAQRQFVSDLAKVQSRRLALAGEEGAFTTTEMARLQREAQQRANEQARIDISEGQLDVSRSRASETRRHNREMEQKAASKSAAANRRLPGGAKVLTQIQHNSAIDRVKSIQSEIQPFVKEVPRHKVARLFKTGAPKTATEAAIKKVPEDWLSVALDLAYDGKLSRRNVQMLQKRGYSVNKLGFPTHKRRGGSPLSQLENPWTQRVRA